jgi:hypothetical protein
VSTTKDTPKEQDRARTAVAEWRAANPGGTLDQMIEATGGDFHQDYGPLLRGTWHLLADREARDRQDAGSSAGTRAEDPAARTGPGGNPPVNAAGGVNGLPARRAGDGGAVVSAPPSPRGGSTP